MNKRFKINALCFAFVVAMMLGILSGCTANDEIIEIHDPEDGLPAPLEDGYIDISLELVPLASTPPMFATIVMPSAPGTKVENNGKSLIDMSNIKDGYVMIKYLTKASKALRVQITGPSGEAYKYTLKSNGDFEVFPLSDGNGKYDIKVLENVSGTKYAVIGSAAFDVKFDDEFAPFLRPNQYVNYTPESKTVKKAEELIKGKTTTLEKISAIYEFVINNLTYDKELAATVQSGYLPEVDKVLEKGKGICFDYAAVMSAMLRSQNIPCKLVIGYTGEVYHAWINAYSEEDGWMDAVIYFDGKVWKLMDPTFASGNSSDAISQYIGKGENYKAKYLY